MATDAAIYPVSAVATKVGLAWTPALGVQSSPGMNTTAARNGANRDGTGRDAIGRDGLSAAELRAQARAPEMELIREAQAGSRVAFDALVRQYEQQVLRLALHLTGSEHDAEDIYQEAFFEGLPVSGEFPL